MKDHIQILGQVLSKRLHVRLLLYMQELLPCGFSARLAVEILLRSAYITCLFCMFHMQNLLKFSTLVYKHSNGIVSFFLLWSVLWHFFVFIISLYFCLCQLFIYLCMDQTYTHHFMIILSSEARDSRCMKASFCTTGCVD